MSFKYKYPISKTQVGRMNYSYTLRTEMNQWLRTNVGEFNIMWNYSSITGNYRFRFKRHYTLFILVWG